MRKSLKKLVSFGLVAGMVVASLTGCGTKDKKEDTKPTTAPAATDTTGETKDQAGDTAGDTTAEATGETKVLKIGGIGPLTGGAASYGISVSNGAKIAIDEINKAGGVKVGDTTYTLELNFVDDEASPDTALTAYNTVMDWGAQVILGTVTSGACAAITDLTFEDGILQITPSGSALDLTQNSNVFRLCFTDPFQGVTLADYVKELGYSKIAIIYNNSDDYSTGIMESFTKQAEANGATIVANESFVTDANDFNTQLTKIKATDAEVIVVPAYYNDAAYITAQAKALGMNLPFLGSDGWDGVIAQSSDVTALEGAIFLSPFLATDENPAIKNFVTTYQTANNSIPDQFAADGYDTVYVIKAAMEKAGSVESAALIEAMTQINVDGLTGSVSFTAEGEPNKGAKYIQIKGGQYVAK